MLKIENAAILTVPCSLLISVSIIDYRPQAGKSPIMLKRLITQLLNDLLDGQNAHFTSKICYGRVGVLPV